MDVNEKSEVLLARLDVKMDAVKAILDELKETVKAHVEKDEVRFVALETDFAQYKGAAKAWVWVIGLIAVSPLAWKVISGFFLHK